METYNKFHLMKSKVLSSFLLLLFMASILNLSSIAEGGKSGKVILREHLSFETKYDPNEGIVTRLIDVEFHVFMEDAEPTTHNLTIEFESRPIVVFVVCFSLFILGLKLKGKTIAQNMVYTALFSLIFILVTSAFTEDIILIIFFSLWIIPIGIVAGLKQRHPILYKSLSALGAIWFLSFCGFLLWQYAMFAYRFPSLLIPLTLVVITLVLIYRVNKNVFASSKRLNWKDPPELFYSATHLKKSIYMSFLIPFCIAFFVFLISVYIHPVISAQVLHTLYSTICGILSTLLGIMVALATFLLSATQLRREIKDLLVGNIKELCLLYGFTILISLMGLIFIPLSGISLNILTIELGIVFQQTIFFIAVGLFGACLSSLIAVFFEIAGCSKSSL